MKKKILVRGIDPLVVKLRTEQVRQGLNNAQLGDLMGIQGQSLERVWTGTSHPTTRLMRKILKALRRPESEGGNPDFVLTDP
jgi:transcriptional regulator with XRE-family HTH domain